MYGFSIFSSQKYLIIYNKSSRMLAEPLAEPLAESSAFGSRLLAGSSNFSSRMHTGQDYRVWMCGLELIRIITTALVLTNR